MAVPALNDPFYQPWIEVDPELKHGGIPGELAGRFVAPRLGDNVTSKNVDVVTIFEVLRDSAASLASHPAAMAEGHPLKNTVEEVLRALNLVMERIIDRTQVMSTNMFFWTHATPPPKDFMLRPILYPLRNPFMDTVIYHLLGTMGETAESNANAMHSGLDPKTSHVILGGLFHLKKNIMRDYFDVEVAGEITLDELNVMFEGIVQPGPTITPPGETGVTPDMGDVAAALDGASALQWYPNQTDWMNFGRKITNAYTPSRIFQPEGATPSTEDVAHPDLVAAADVISPG